MGSFDDLIPENSKAIATPTGGGAFDDLVPNSDVTPVKPDNHGFASGFTSAIQSRPSTYGHGIEAFGDITGIEPVQNLGQSIQDQSTKTPIQTMRWADIDSVKDVVVDYIPEKVGEGVGSMVTSVVSGLAGGGLGAGGGFLVGGAPGAATGATIGGIAGAAADAIPANVGELRAELINEGIDEKEASKHAATWGAVFSIPDVAVVGKVLNKFGVFGQTKDQLRKQVIGKIKKEIAEKQYKSALKKGLKQTGKDVAEVGLFEAGTEAGQTVGQQAVVSNVADTPFLTADNAEELVGATLAGFFGGSVVTSPSVAISVATSPPIDIQEGQTEQGLGTDAQQQEPQGSVQVEVPPNRDDLADAINNDTPLAESRTIDLPQVDIDPALQQEGFVVGANIEQTTEDGEIINGVVSTAQMIDGELEVTVVDQNGEIRTLFASDGDIAVVNEPDPVQQSPQPEPAPPAPETTQPQAVQPPPRQGNDYETMGLEQLTSVLQNVKANAKAQGWNKMSTKIARQVKEQLDTRFPEWDVPAKVDVAEAAQDVNPEPTDAQKEAGNYKKGHVSIQGLPITLENTKGGERSGTDANGNQWSVVMPAHYGYIKRTEGADSEQVDVYVGDNPSSPSVFIVDQIDDQTRAFDEHKIFIGFQSADEVKVTYNNAFNDGRAIARYGGMTEMTVPEFKDWLKNGNNKKPLKYQKPETQTNDSDNATPTDNVAQTADQTSQDSVDTPAEPEPAPEPEAAPESVQEDRPVEEPSPYDNPDFQRTRSRIDEALQSKDSTFLRDVLGNTTNKLSRGYFEQQTGVQLPKTVSGTLQAIDDYLGITSEQRSQITAEREEKSAEERRLRDIKFYGSQLERAKIEGAENVKEWIDARIEEGYNRIGRRGKQYILARADGAGYSLSKFKGLTVEARKYAQAVIDGLTEEQKQNTPREEATQEAEPNSQNVAEDDGGAETQDAGSPPPQEITYNGTKISPTLVNQGEGVPPKTMWSVQTIENRQRELDGKPASVLGNTLHDTLDEAKKQADFEKRKFEEDQKREQRQKEEQRLEQEKADAIKSDTLNGFLDGKTPMQQGKIRKNLSTQIRFSDVGVLTKRQRIESLWESGNLETDSFEENKVKPMTSRQIMRSDNAQQAAHEKRVKEAGKKTTYLVNGSDLGKVAYDYANHLLSKSKADKQENISSKIQDKGKSITDGKTSAFNINPVNPSEYQGTAIFVKLEYKVGQRSWSNADKRAYYSVRPQENFESNEDYFNGIANELGIEGGKYTRTSSMTSEKIDEYVKKISDDVELTIGIVNNPSRFKNSKIESVQSWKEVENQKLPEDYIGNQKPVKSDKKNQNKAPKEALSLDEILNLKPGDIVRVGEVIAPYTENSDQLKGQLKEGDTLTIDRANGRVLSGKEGTVDTNNRYVFKESKPKSDKGDKSNNQKIEDFGEKLEGARKDTWEAYNHSLTSKLPDDLSQITMSKHFPEPNYEQLIEDGMDVERLATFKAIRDEVKNKPRQPYKLARWVSDVKQLREMAHSILNDQKSFERFKSEGEKVRQLGGFFDRIQLYKDLGYPAFTKAKDWNIRKSTGVIENGVKLDRAVWFVAKKSSWGTRFDSYEEAVKALKAELANQKSGAKKTKLDIYVIRKTKEVIIGKKVAAGKFIDLKGGFETSRDASKYLRENYDELVELLEKKKTIAPMRRETNEPRIGEDYRNGKDVSPDQFAETFGFRGVQFGNYVEQSKRVQDLNDAFDGLTDMAKIIGVPERALSLNGTLGLAFGARGKGAAGSIVAKAHYEPDHVVINLTKKSGAGSLGHEWWHSLDNYFGKMNEGEFITDRPYARKYTADGERDVLPVRQEVVDAYNDVVKAIRKDTKIEERSKKLDKLRSKDYYSTIVEMTARAFEGYLIHKAEQKGGRNDYLANISSQKAYEAIMGEGTYPYPTESEIDVIVKAYDKLFDTIETKADGDNIAMFSLADQTVNGLQSQLLQAAKDMKQQKGTGAQILAMLRKTAGVKDEEIAWTGLDDFIRNRGGVTKDEVVKYLEENQVKIEEVTLNDRTPSDEEIQTLLDDEAGEGLTWEEARETIEDDYNAGDGSAMFAQYTLPGGENYREVLLTLPQGEGTGPYEALRRQADTLKDRRLGDVLDDGRTVQETLDDIRAQQNALTEKDQFKSSHFDQPNILAHVRLNDRTTADGKRVLFVEEIQSDWHQAGRKKGYKGQEQKELRAKVKEAQDNFEQWMKDNPSESASVWREQNPELSQAVARMGEIESSEKGKVPDAPFKKNWHEMAFRRVAQMAAQNGYDAVAWAPGEVQNERYDLSKHIGRVVYNPTSRQLFAYDKNDPSDAVIKETGVTKDKLADYLGKDVSERLLNDDNALKTTEGAVLKYEMRGQDLKVGGEGMKGFYDKILKKYAEKFGKKYGAKVGVTPIVEGKFNPLTKKFYDNGYEVKPEDAKITDVWTMPITDSMREAANAGFALFRKTDAPINGKFASKMEKAINARLKALGWPQANFRISNDLAETFGVSGVEGAYWRGIIHVSMQAKDILGTINHEVIHGLKAFGAFTDAEWGSLEKRAPEWRKKYKIDQNYADVIRSQGVTNPSVLEAKLNEEAIAHAFQDFGNKGIVRRIANRAVKFIKTIGNVLSGKPYNFSDANAVFDAVEKGEIGARLSQDTGSPSNSVPTFSRRLSFKFDEKKAKGVVKNPEQYEGASSIPVESDAFKALPASWKGNLGWIKEDGILSKAGKKNIVAELKSNNSKILRKERDRQEKRFLKDIQKNYWQALDNVHKNRNLNFKALPVGEVGGLNKINLHKSQTRGGRQSSEYHLALLDGEPVYIRKSNHWGTFRTNIKDVDSAMRDLGMSREDAEEAQINDPFGRIGSKTHNWELEGGQRRKDGDYAETSQAGFIPLRELLSENSQDDFPMYKLSRRKGPALEQAKESLAQIRGLENNLGSDLKRLASWVLHPQQIATLYKEFTPVYRAMIERFKQREVLVHQLSKNVDLYNKLDEDAKTKVNAALEIGRLSGKTFKAQADGTITVTNEGLKNTVHSSDGDTITLSPTEAAAYLGVRRTMDMALDKYMETILEEYGLLEQGVKTIQDVEKLRLKAAKDGMVNEVRRFKEILQRLNDVKDAKKKGYIPFKRWGEVGVSVKDADGEMVHFERIELPKGWRKKGRIGENKTVQDVLERLSEKYNTADYDINFFEMNRFDEVAANIDLRSLDILASSSEMSEKDYHALREMLEKEMQKRGFRSHFFRSKDVPGYSEDFERAINDYVVSISSYISRRMHEKNIEAAVSSIAESGKPDLHKYAQEYQEYSNDPEEELATIRMMGFFWYLAGNISSGLVNLTQPFLVTAPWFSAKFNHTQIGKQMSKAYVDAAKIVDFKESGMDTFNFDKAPADIRDALKKAYEEGDFLSMATHDAMAISNSSTIALRGLEKKKRWVQDAIALTFSIPERTNRVVTFIAAYRLALDPKAQEKIKEFVKNDNFARSILEGKTGEDFAFAYAELAVVSTQYRVGKLNRPKMSRGLLSLPTQFWSFMMQTFELMYKLSKVNGGRNKTAVAAMMLSIVAVAGLKGIPFEDDLQDIIERLYKFRTGKDLDIDTKMREFLVEKTNPFIAETLIKGAPASVLNLDMSGRLGFGNVAPDRGSDFLGVWWDMLYERPVRAAEYANKGDVLRAVAEVSPAFLRNPLTAYTWADDGIRTQKGSKVLDSEDVSNWDVGLKFFGFTTSKVSRKRDEIWAASRINTAVDDLRGRYYSRIAKALAERNRLHKAGDAEGAEQMSEQIKAIMDEIRHHNATHDLHERIFPNEYTIKQRYMEEMSGAEARRVRKQARPRREELKEIYGYE